MAPMFSRGERVRVLATKFDNGTKDSGGMTFSERWLADGRGTWCYGTVSRLLVKRGRKPQRYSVKYDVGGTMTCEEEHIENAGVEESESDVSMDGDRADQDSDSDNDVDETNNETDNEADEGGTVENEDQDNVNTDESEGENAGETDRDWREAEVVEIGETVWCGKEGDRDRQCWRRVDGINADVRTEETHETTVKNIGISDSTTGKKGI